MNRRTFLGVSSAAAAAATSRHSFASPAAGSSQRPNFLFLIADDLMFRTIK